MAKRTKVWRQRKRKRKRRFLRKRKKMRESGKTYRSQLWKLTELEFAEWPFAVVALFESSDSVKFCLISEDKKRGGSRERQKTTFIVGV